MSNTILFIGRALPVCLLILNLSCTRATPEVELLGELEPLRFNGETQFEMSFERLGEQTIEGSCDPRTKALEFSLDGGKSYQNFTKICSKLVNECTQSQTFLCEASLSYLNFKNGISSQQSLHVRAVADKKKSATSYIKLSYLASSANIHSSLFSGEVQGQNDNLKMKVRVDSRTLTAEGEQQRLKVKID